MLGYFSDSQLVGHYQISLQTHALTMHVFCNKIRNGSFSVYHHFYLFSNVFESTSFQIMLSSCFPSFPIIVRCQTKVYNCKCCYLLWYFLVLLSKILLLIEFFFIRSRVFLIFSHCPKYMPDIIFLTEILFERRSNIACLCYFRSPSYGGPYDGQRFLFAVYATFAPHRMGLGAFWHCR